MGGGGKERVKGEQPWAMHTTHTYEEYQKNVYS